MNPKFIAVMASWKTSFRSCFKLGTNPQCYGFMITSFDHFSIYATKTRTKIAYERKAKENLSIALLLIFQNENLKHISFLHTQNHKRKVTANNFSNYFTFSPTEINIEHLGVFYNDFKTKQTLNPSLLRTK